MKRIKHLLILVGLFALLFIVVTFFISFFTTTSSGTVYTSGGAVVHQQNPEYHVYTWFSFEGAVHDDRWGEGVTDLRIIFTDDEGEVIRSYCDDSVLIGNQGGNVYEKNITLDTKPSAAHFWYRSHNITPRNVVFERKNISLNGNSLQPLSVKPGEIECDNRINMSYIFISDHLDKVDRLRQ